MLLSDSCSVVMVDTMAIRVVALSREECKIRKEMAKNQLYSNEIAKV